MSLFLIFVIGISQILSSKSQQEVGGILCTELVCKDYIKKIGGRCPDASKCSPENTNHSGILLPSGPDDPCNCCPHCLINIAKGKPCDKGSLGGIIPQEICGPGLSCGDDKICKRMSTKCTQAQDLYDEQRASGSLGHLQIRPNCDADGLFKPYKCIPEQTCFCVDKEGTRIYGEVPFTNLADLSLKCECSRKYYDAVKIIGRDLHPHEHFRCASNGDYDSLQCIGDMCMCVDSEDGAPSEPLAPSVNITEISNNTLPNCFDKKLHTEKKFYYECAAKHLEIARNLKELQKEGYSRVYGTQYPNCNLDGKYAAVQRNKTLANCVDPDGRKIQNYGASSEDGAAFESIDCKCARTNLLTRQANIEKPICCPNGNFHPVQCRRGLCRCVDADGYQTAKEVVFENIKELPCYKDQRDIVDYCGDPTL